jgi:hypothetical protein
LIDAFGGGLSAPDRVHYDITNFCQEFDSVLFRVEKDNSAQPRTNDLILSGHKEIAVRGAVDLEMSRMRLPTKSPGQYEMMIAWTESTWNPRSGLQHG